ncbi:MAG: hypothetical protein VKK04_06755 [Synechococcales bacterium]|nr:hypothetical protein [Synechococcales bacterium]
MQTVVLPFRLIVNQALLLLLAIAIEAMVLRQQLKYPPRKSIEYSASINLWSTLIGWLIFFVVAGGIPLLPAIKLELINFIFFDRWSPDLFSWLVTAGFFTFFITVFVELIGFLQLQRLRQEREEIESKYTQQRRLPKYIKASRLGPGINAPSTDRTNEAEPLYAILVANAASYTAIVAVLVALQVASRGTF